MKNRTRLSRLAWIRAAASNGEAQRIRESAGLSRPEFAPEIPTDATTLWRWETGKSRPTTDAALRWEAALTALIESAA